MTKKNCEINESIYIWSSDYVNVIDITDKD